MARFVHHCIFKVANKCCQGRLVSVLEGGYRIQGGIVSAFGRSVAGHVRALVDGCESRQVSVSYQEVSMIPFPGSGEERHRYK